MADVFLSYKREDLAHAKRIANAVAEEGFTVFFDVHDDVGIHVGESWDQRLEHELSSTKTVIVLWSRLSVASNNVRDEARRAAARGILVPVMLDDCEPPLGLGILQTVDLSDWLGDRSDNQWRQLIDRGVARVVSGTVSTDRPVTLPQGAAAASETRMKPRRRYAIPAALLLGAVVLVAVNIALFGYARISHQEESQPQADVAKEVGDADASVETFHLSVSDDDELEWLRTNIERNLVELLWTNDLKVAHALTSGAGDGARLRFTGDINRVGEEITVSISMHENGRIAGTAEVTAPPSDFQDAYRALPAALLYFMNRNSLTLEPMKMTQRPTKVVRAWWMFEEAKRHAASGRTERAIDFLDRAHSIDPRFASALWAKGDLISSNGDPEGEILKANALAEYPDLQRHSIHATPIDPMPALLAAVHSSEWKEIEVGLSLRKFATKEYGITVTAWHIDPTMFSIEVIPAAGTSGETVEQIRVREGAILAVNGGYWDEDAAGRVTPSGLFITEGTQLKPFKEGAGSGVFLMTPDGPHIQYGNSPLPPIINAGVQAGPIVIEPGGEIGIRTRNAVRAARTAVCVTTEDSVLLLVTEGGLSLYELATLLGTQGAETGFDCDVALNLGGGPTTQAAFLHAASKLQIAGLWKTQSALVVRRH